MYLPASREAFVPHLFCVPSVSQVEDFLYYVEIPSFYLCDYLLQLPLPNDEPINNM
jgi:hypothetical protein